MVPHIYDPLTVQPVDMCSRIYNHLSQLDFADTFDDKKLMEVDMLIGVDFYWDLVTRETS